MNVTKLASIFCGLTLSSMGTTAFAVPSKDAAINKSRIEVYGGLLYLQPTSNNLRYAVFVSGQQPYLQSWHYQAINPNYSPAFEIGLNYNFTQLPYQASVSWLRLNTSNSSHKQASEVVSLSTVEFVAPAYEVGPPAFGVKRADANVKFDFDDIKLNVGRLFDFGANLQAKVFGGVNILRLNQRVTAVFSDYPGALPTPYSYALAPDPAFIFETQNVSKYLGAGPDFGVNIQYTAYHGFGFVGEILGSLTAGTNKVIDNFNSNSSRLIALGLGPTHQEITTPDATQVVAGFDGKLGAFYNYSGRYIQNLTIEAGYRVAFYNNAISDVNPSSLVQAGTVFITPEFATGTMAINSTEARSRNFGFNGPYLTFKIAAA
ncbi:Lpg1974 family pore-forming outer membrane protein [Legionella drancourtii]|uniref:Major outer membrane protein n=1 Tax=Legionella drancourtii LLAP12 TaxID=658187 RepID=G9ELY3_9GAMM|nr:Lpg1974 family pore-forming outer membrane protein [Legionella drancourtii]EHL31583.1 hypothetical protein LDG_6244 [Legionella drancourtii LLAP12]